MSEDKSLEENFETANARITPGVTIGGMGEVSLPNAENGNIGSGDVPDVADIDDDEEEAKKDKTKKKLEMEGFKLFTQFNNFITEAKIPNFKFGQKTQYSFDDINDQYGFWGTLEVNMDPESIEEIWHEVWGILTKSWKFSDAGALSYLNAKAGRWLADKVWNDINSQISQLDAIDMILSDYARPSKWKAWAKEYNEHAQEELAESDKIYEEAVLENAVRDLHFETDPDKAEELKIEIGASQGEVTRRKQIEGGEYSLRRFRKEIKYDETGEDLGVFKPGSYMAATSKLGDGPHKKAVKKVRWNQKMYDQWIEDVASNGGWQHAFDMAQNAKHERGLIDWVKKNHRGEDPMQRIQWDIEAFAESVVTEKLARGLKPLLTLGSTLKKNAGEDALLDLSDKFDILGDEDADNIASYLNMAIELMQDGYGKSATEKLKQFNKACKDALAGKEVGSAFESVAKDLFSKWCKLNEAKSINRDEMMKWIEKYMDFVGTTEDFSGSQGGIHVSGEDGDEYKGSVIYSYYSEDYKNREFGVWNKWEKELNKRGWYSEWYDAGTVCIWPL